MEETVQLCMLMCIGFDYTVLQIKFFLYCHENKLEQTRLAIFWLGH